MAAAAFAGKGRRGPYEPYFRRCHSAAGRGVYILEVFFSFFIRSSTKLRTTPSSCTERPSLVERRQRCDDAEIFGTNVSVVSRLTTGIEWKLLPPMMLAWEQCCGDGFGICCLHGGYPVSSVLDLGNRFAVLGSWNCTVLNLLYYLCHFLLSLVFFSSSRLSWWCTLETRIAARAVGLWSKSKNSTSHDPLEAFFFNRTHWRLKWLWDCSVHPGSRMHYAVLWSVSIAFGRSSLPGPESPVGQWFQKARQGTSDSERTIEKSFSYKRTFSVYFSTRFLPCFKAEP